MNLIYSCIFFNEQYLELIELLLKTYILFGSPDKNTRYLIICNPDFKSKIEVIFKFLHIDGLIWCIDLHTIFEACYSRLKIFDYPDIDKYNKILYLDCDILITNDLSNILNFQLDDKLYALNEGHSLGPHDWWGSDFFTPDSNPKTSVFSTCVLLFNNCQIIKNLFNNTLSHIYSHLKDDLPLPMCYDQPFIIYNTVKDNLHDNQKLIHIVINDPWHTSFNGETISHFPSAPGDFNSKHVKMMKYLYNTMFHVQFIPNPFIPSIIDRAFYIFDPISSPLQRLSICFLHDGSFSNFPGSWRPFNSYLIRADFANSQYLFKFNSDLDSFIAIRNKDFRIFYGYLIQ